MVPFPLPELQVEGHLLVFQLPSKPRSLPKVPRLSLMEARRMLSSSATMMTLKLNV